MMNVFSTLLNGSGSFTVAFRIALVYAILGALWIAFSDQLLITLFDPDTVPEYATLQTYKGWFFILLTSIILVFLIMSNVKNLKKAERARYSTEALYRTVFENTGTAIAIIDEDMTVSLVNQKFADIAGLRQKDLERKVKWTDLIENDDLPKMIEYYRKQKLNDTGAPVDQEFRILSKGGVQRHVLLSLASIPGSTQSIVSLIDITDKKDLEKKYLRAQRMESIGTLSSGIAHDLNNILAPILLAAETLRKEPRDKKSKRLLQIVETSAKRGTELIRQILTFSRGTRGDHVSLQPRYVISEIAQIMRSTFPKSIEIETDIPNDLQYISANSIQVHQAILNLCVNARDAMPDGGKLTIRAENTTINKTNEALHPEVNYGAYVVISISDTGTGIPEEIRDKLFSTFFTTKEDGRGTGLGLATVDYIMKNHGGFLALESTVGRGSTFKLYFSVIDDKPVDTYEPVTTPPMGKGQQILIIDDEAAVCEMISEILRTYNYKVMIANDGTEGLSMYIEHRDVIDLVLTDSNMPFLGGEKLIRALYDANPDIRIFITTGAKNLEEKYKNLQPPIVGYLQKPYSSYSLLTQLHEILQ